jgi:hypothetical protein
LSTLFREAPPLSPDDQYLVDLYISQDRAVDALPYTDDFERLFVDFSKRFSRTKHDVVQSLFNLRKAGRLPRLGRSALTAIDISEEDVAILEELVIDKVGSWGQRDRLVYSSAFDELAAEFNRSQRVPLTDSEIWRLIARVTK